jgi:glycosyltransferase involved in cell wall biosynthesis
MAFRHLLKQPLPDGASFSPVAKRVVLVCSSLAPGGAERQVAYTLAGLASKPTESVQLLCDHLAPGEQRYDFYLPYVKAAGIRARQITTRANPGHMQHLPHRLREVERYLPSGLIADIANLYHEFIDLRPEVVHAWLDWSSIRAGIAAALAGVPKIVLCGRNLNPSHFNLYDFYMDPAYRALAALPNVTLLNNSQAGADDYADWIGIAPERIRVLRNGIDFGPQGRLSDDEIAALRAEYAIPKGAFVVGGVFRLLPEKRPLLWVETAAAVQRRIPNAYFIVFGLGPMKADMEAQARSFGISDRLVLAGVTDQALSAMSIMDVFMLTSYGEGLPNVVLEAQWVGTPVVATRAGGTGEAIDQGVTGWIVDEPSASALAAQVCALHVDPPLRVKARARGSAFVRSRFGLKRMIDETWSAYGYDVEAGAMRTLATAKSS